MPDKPVAAFYLLIPRAWELLMGSLLAMKLLPPLTHRIYREIAGWVGLGLIAYAVFIFTKNTPFPGANALLPCLGTTLIIYASEGGRSWACTLLRFPPLVFIGVISYSLYLWHWPLLVFTRYFYMQRLDNLQIVLVIMASFIMAFLSFEFIESPFRGAGSRFTRRQIFLFGICASIAGALTGFIIYATEGLPQRYTEPKRTLLVRNIATKTDYKEMCNNWHKDVHSLSDIEFCFPEQDGQKKIMFWGDSHVQQLIPLLQKMIANKEFQDQGVIIAASGACPPTEHLNNSAPDFHCDSFSQLAMKRAREPDIDTVFIVFSTWWALPYNSICPSVDGQCTRPISKNEQFRLFFEELAGHIRILKGQGKRVIVSLPFPLYNRSIPVIIIHNLLFGNIVPLTVREKTPPNIREQVDSVARAAGAEIFDPRASLCPNDQCITEIDGVAIYRDDSHIVASQISILEENLKHVLGGGR